MNLRAFLAGALPGYLFSSPVVAQRDSGASSGAGQPILREYDRAPDHVAEHVMRPVLQIRRHQATTSRSTAKVRKHRCSSVRAALAPASSSPEWVHRHRQSCGGRGLAHPGNCLRTGRSCEIEWPPRTQLRRHHAQVGQQPAYGVCDD
jgi:hypothetical protein